jgi:hypothetical protein
LLQSLTAATLKLRRCTSKQEIRALLRSRSQERARTHLDWLRQHEEQFLGAVAHGTEVEPSQIRPVLQAVTVKEERDLFRFARFTSSLPFSDRVGRRMRFLIRDSSLPRMPLIGIAALGSPVLDLRPRDDWVFGSGGISRQARQRGLTGLSELYIAVGLRPYSDLLAGKLICYCMATREIHEAYNQKYVRHGGRPLAVIYTLGAFGPHCSQYNRVSIRGKLLYQQVGVTDGWSVSHIPDYLVKQISEYLSARQITIRYALRGKTPSKFHIVHRFLRNVGVRPDSVFFTGVRRAVYVCPLAKNFREVFSKCEKPNYDVPSLQDAISWWQHRWLSMRCKNLQVMERVRSFSPEAIYTARKVCGRRNPEG